MKLLPRDVPQGGGYNGNTTLGGTAHLKFGKAKMSNIQRDLG